MRIFLIAIALVVLSTACSSNRHRASQPSAEQIAAQQQAAAENRRRWQEQQRAAQRQAKLQQENAQKQQQIAIDQMYDREFRQFLRTEGYSNASSLSVAARTRINYFRENTNPTEEQKQKFFNSLSVQEQNNILKLEEPEFHELVSKFEDDLQTRINSQQNAQRQQALRALGQLQGIQNRGNTGYSPASPGAMLACGMKPFPPRLGCQYTQCVNGRWVEVCQ